jgi:hypothetical protein
MQRLSLIPLSLLLLLFAAACNANSDAVRVLEAENTSLRATVASYQAAGPTMTAQVTTMAQRLATAQSDLGTARAQVKDLTAKLNSSAQPPSQVIVQDTPGASGSTEQAANASAPTNFAFADVSTAKGVDSMTGCAVNKSNTFAVTDPRIWLVADVRNYKGGTNFVAKWSFGDFDREFNWTVPQGGKQVCVNFYIEPKTLGLKAGTYTVTLSATGLTSDPVQFTVK